MNRLFCDSMERPEFCVYSDYDPVICCVYCDKKDKCWSNQEECDEKIPCLGQDIVLLKCELRF